MKIIRWIFRGLAAVFVLLLLLLTISFLINRGLPAESENPAQLGSAEKARIAEFIQVRHELGDTVWPGWGTADIPLVLYNESYAFLIGYEQPPDGWYKVPQDEHRGGPWELVAADNFNGRPYYRQPLPASGETPQAFTVKIGRQWAASMTTMEWMEISLANQFRDELPPFLKEVFPYPMVTGLFLRGSEGFISLVAHESFHAYQGTVTEAHLAAAETGLSAAEQNYPWLETETAWQTELDLLVQALQAETEEETAQLVRQFIRHRSERRVEAGLSLQSVEYERQREWLEGLARYVELEIWRQASLAQDYEPLTAVLDDPDFSGYGTFDRRWSQEMDQIGRMAGDEGDGRFYYSGMAQAVLLDRLMPGWKAQVLSDGVFLEGLLIAAAGS